jgi:hypothetical protein
VARRSITASTASLRPAAAGVEERLELVERQLERVQDQVGRFVEGFGAAVAEKQLGGVEAGDGVAQQVARRGEQESCSWLSR